MIRITKIKYEAEGKKDVMTKGLFIVTIGIKTVELKLFFVLY